MTQMGFVFDVNKCTGCSACEIACTIENELDRDVLWRQVGTFNPGHYPDIPVFHHSLACNHCLDPPCMKYCPALAFSKDSITGAVTIDSDKCIGCRYCAWVCPYDAPQFNPNTGVIEKCTFCLERLVEGLSPACAQICPTGALECRDHDRGRREKPVLGLPQANIGPAIEIIALEKKRVFPRMTAGSEAKELEYLSETGGYHMGTRLTLRGEWSLIVFSFVSAWLVGALGASISSTFVLNSGAFLSIGIVAMLLSILHLGRRDRAHRAILNYRNSWVSREVLFFVLFLSFGSLYLSTGPANDILGWTALTVGIATLFAMERVYGVTGAKGSITHSGGVLTMGFFAWGVLSGNIVLAVTLALVKLLLYSLRRARSVGSHGPTRTLWSVFRVGSGLVVPSVIWLFGSRDWFIYAGVGAFAGELLDRCEYYLDLDIPSPRREMALELERHISRRGTTSTL